MNEERDRQDNPSELSHLLKPSPSSTGRSSTEQDVEVNNTVRPLLANGSRSTNGLGGGQVRSMFCSGPVREPKESSLEFWDRQHSHRKRNMAIIASFSVILLAIIIVPAYLKRGTGTGTGSSTGNVSPLPPPDRHIPQNVDLQAPLSLLHPARDLGLASVVRPYDSSPPLAMTHHHNNSNGDHSTFRAYRTNSWYNNFLLLGDDEEPQDRHRVYSIPYIVDASASVPGLRVHPNFVTSSSDVVQLNVVEQYALTVGASADAAAASSSDRKKTEPTELSHRYNVETMTDLGVTLRWVSYPMKSSITKGMPYSTMVYDELSSTDRHGNALLPTVASDIPLAQKPIVDGTTEVGCIVGSPATFVVQREIEVLFAESDFTWIIFFSRPVEVQCVATESGSVQFQVVGTAKSSSSQTYAWSNTTTGHHRQVKARALTASAVDHHDHDEAFVIRVALYKQCTSGHSAIWCHQEQLHPTALLVGQGEYGDLLREHAHLYPGPNPAFTYEMNTTSSDIRIKFDWDVKVMSSTVFGPGPYGNLTAHELLTFALPHHYYMFENFIFAGRDQIYCDTSVIGPVCLVEASKWVMIEKVPEISLRAPRPIAPWALAELAKSLPEDLRFKLPPYFMRGGGDTYFSGKMLAKLGRILLVAEEVADLCQNGKVPTTAAVVEQMNRSPAGLQSDYKEACKELSLPSEHDRDHALAVLRSSVEVWINGSAETPFVFDSAWGGVVSCGCLFENGDCINRFPNCPGFDMPGLDFGNAFYNDCHFHFGYFIYAAAVVSHFDPTWAKEQFENVLLLVRSIANPSTDDLSFPTFRHKDWYQGHSWASGIARPVYLNGKNQESSSEAIAAYEAVALYGSVMVSVWEEERLWGRVEQAERVRRAGVVLTATELRAAHTYWHVTAPDVDGSVKIYPSSYANFVVGILWQMMAQFQTWFGRIPYLMYGIQVLPLTPISEIRDNLNWAKLAYDPLAKSCEVDEMCSTTGWGVLQIALLATVGHPKDAMEMILQMPPEAFDGAAGDGHSLSNTLWYISTRPFVKEPLPITKPASMAPHRPARNHPIAIATGPVVTDCNRPKTCTDYVLDTIAGLYTCRQRIQWLMQMRAWTEEDACAQIGGVENSKECGPCNPLGTNDAGEQNVRTRCPPCTQVQCDSDVNRCPSYEETFVCLSGASMGGCAGSPWNLDDGQCNECCELSSCSQNAKKGSASILRIGDLDRVSEGTDCPLCSKSVCRSRVNQCPSTGEAPFLCYEGASEGGCSPTPWHTDEGKLCEKCCTVTPGCEN